MMRGVVSREGQMNILIETDIDQTNDDLNLHALTDIYPKLSRLR